MADGKVHAYGGKILNVGGKVAGCDGDCCGEAVECPCCDVVWNTSLYTGDWVADLGAGGWTNVDGTKCNTLSGEFTLSDGGYACPAADYVDTSGGAFLCNATNYDFAVNITLAISGENCDDPEIKSWDYLLTVWYYSDDDIGGLFGSLVYYRGVGQIGDDCFDPFDEDGEMVLTKWGFGDIHGTACTPVKQACAGNLPATVTIWREEK